MNKLITSKSGIMVRSPQTLSTLNLNKKYSFGEKQVQIKFYQTQESCYVFQTNIRINYLERFQNIDEKYEKAPSFSQKHIFSNPPKFDEALKQKNHNYAVSESRQLQRARSQKIFNLDKNDFIQDKIQKLDQITQKLSQIKKNLVETKTKIQLRQMQSLKNSQLQKQLRISLQIQHNAKMQNLYKILRDYYVVPIVQNYPNIDRPHMLHLYNNIRKLSTFNQTRKFTQNLSENFYTLNLSRNKENDKKYTLVLDLDQTLVYCRKYNLKTANPSNHVIQMPDKNQKNMKIQVLIRPYAKDFLKEMAKHYELIVFTASKKKYAQQIIQILDPSRKYISHTLCRQHCTVFTSKSGITHVKDLRILNRNLDNLLIVDNELTSYMLQLQNGVPIIPYSGESNDMELKRLELYLTAISGSQNLRRTNSKVFKYSQYNQIQSFQIGELVQKYKNQNYQ